MSRLFVISGHLLAQPVAAQGVSGKTLPKAEVLQAFATDPAWAGKPFWMLNVLKFKADGAGASKYAEYSDMVRQDALPKIGARIVMSGYARTVVGRNEYHAVAIVEYPSPEAFITMAMSKSFEEKNAVRLQGLEEQYLIPMRPGWYHIDRAAPEASQHFTHFTAETVHATPNGMVGSSARGARVGRTSASLAQAEALVRDERIGGTNVVWHLNLLRFAGDAGKETYARYAKAMGGKSGVLSRFGARSTLARDCYRSLLGDFDFDQAIIAEYPCRDSFLSMGASSEYFETAHFRHEGLEETYIISCLPEYVDQGQAPPTMSS